MTGKRPSRAAWITISGTLALIAAVIVCGPPEDPSVGRPRGASATSESSAVAPFTCEGEEQSGPQTAALVAPADATADEPRLAENPLRRKQCS